MKKFCPASTSAMVSSRLLLCSFLVMLSTLFCGAAEGPSWWTGRLKWQQNTVLTNNPANDYAAVNQGQLKNIASYAAEEMNAQLPGGAGVDINALVSSWKESAPSGTVRNDYAAVNIGQLKTVAKLFYTRLIAVGFTSSYPWSVTTADDNDYAAANVGQVKFLFRFDLSSDRNSNGVPDWWEDVHGLDSDLDQDGLPDWWEIAHFGNLWQTADGDFNHDGTSNLEKWLAAQNSPDVYYRHLTPGLTVISGNNQHALPNRYLVNPFAVRVTNPATGTVLTNAPVTFEGDLHRLVAPSANGPGSSRLTVWTDNQGVARVYFRVSAHEGANACLASAGNTQIALSGVADYDLPPLKPVNFKSAYVSASETLMNWQDVATDEAYYLIERSRDREEWETIAKLQAGTQSYTTNYGSGDTHYFYRVISCYNGQL